MHRLCSTLLCCTALCLTDFCPDSIAGDQQRIPWTGKKLRGTAEPAAPFHATRVWPNLQVKAPVYLRRTRQPADIRRRPQGRRN